MPILTKSKKSKKGETGQDRTKRDRIEGGKILTFGDLVQKLYTHCGNGVTQPNFIRTMLSKITSEQEDSIFEKDDTDLRKIFSGTRKLPKKSASYILTHLDKGKFDTYIYDLLSEDALTELCNEFEPFVGNASITDITAKISDLFVSILKSITAKTEMAETKVHTVELSNFVIERELTEIVKTLTSLPPSKRRINLTYEPYNVDKKILPANFSLMDEIKKDVVENYVFIEDLFKNASHTDTSFFDQFASEVKYVCDNMILQPHSQEEVFYAMVKWLKDRVSCKSDIACRKIISFFVQNCEVFHAFTE